MQNSTIASFFRRHKYLAASLIAVVALVAGLVAADDERSVNFVRPGLRIQVIRADVAADGTLRVQFKLSDPQNLPLDREGITTPGTIATSFVVAYIGQDKTQYTSYTTRTQTSPINGRAAIQAASDTGGRYERLAEGEYAYTFGTRLPAGFDRSATHSVLIYGSRNLNEFDLGVGYFDTVFNWVPAGGTVTKVRDVVRTATCNTCHVDMGFHGGARKSMEGCVMCHQPQTTDPDTGNTVDMAVMAHKIHMGNQLPSVQSGKKYCIIGNAQTEHCYDKVVFPAGPNNCKVCHNTDLAGAAKPAQVDAHLKSPTRASCGACHDQVNFASGENHVNLPQPNDNGCSTCHTPQGELEFDASIIGAHTTPTRAPSLPGIRFEIVSVDDGVAGRRPRVTFTIKNKAGETVLPSQMTSFSFVLAGPTSDYSTYVQETATGAQDVGGGRFAYTFNASIPATARGSFSIGMQGYRNATLLPGTTIEQTVRDAGVNVVRSFTVDGSPVEPRRQVVTTAKCNSCHDFLSLHGGNRNTVEMCVLCHNPTMTDAARRPAGQTPAEAINFGSMVHRIHNGEEQQRDFTIFGNGNVPHNYNEVGYPGILSNCASCHVNNSQRLPLSENLLPVTDPRGFITKPGAATAACLGCHATRSAAAHAAANTNEIGESCATCHGPNAEFSVDRAHARP
jgi:OmcA/MtrC family decaheme c-type cytochrome